MYPIDETRLTFYENNRQTEDDGYTRFKRSRIRETLFASVISLIAFP